MKITSKIFFTAILFGIMFLNNTCSKEKMFSKVTFEGYVYDSLGGKPVEGVWIGLGACVPMTAKSLCDWFVVGQSKTDAAGHFYIHDNAARSDRYSPILNGHPIGSLNISGDELSIKYSKIYLK